METIRKRIQTIGRLLYIFTRIANVVLKILLITCLVAAVGTLFIPGFMDDASSFADEITIFRYLKDLVDLSQFEMKYQIAIAFGTGFLSFSVLLFYTHFFESITKEIKDGNQPFTLTTAKKLRKISYTMLLLILTSPFLSIVLFLVTLLFSYLIEYGAYLQEKADLTNKVQEEMIVSFAEITENKSGQTGQHIKRVSEYARIIADEMGLPEESAETLRLASTMHDIGKLLVPTEILEKPARLTDDEFAEIKKHTTYGGQLLENVEGDVMEVARRIALEHHERVDGRGYPYGYDADKISLEGRIVAVADVYDALTSRRSYKDAWDDKEAYDEIVKNAGSQFDPDVIKAFQAAYPKINETRKIYADQKEAL